MSYIDLDQSEVIKQAEIGLIRAIRYMPQFLGITEKRNYQHDKERMSFPEFVLQQSEAIGAEIAVAKHFGTPIENLANTNYKTLADVGANIVESGAFDCQRLRSTRRHCSACRRQVTQLPDCWLDTRGSG